MYQAVKQYLWRPPKNQKQLLPVSFSSHLSHSHTTLVLSTDFARFWVQLHLTIKKKKQVQKTHNSLWSIKSFFCSVDHYLLAVSSHLQSLVFLTTAAEQSLKKKRRFTRPVGIVLGPQQHTKPLPWHVACQWNFIIIGRGCWLGPGLGAPEWWARSSFIHPVFVVIRR